MDPQPMEFTEQLQAQFNLMPKVVQNAIRSSDVEKHLRELANTHKLHLDQWETLENEVMLALLAFKPAEDLKTNIKNEVVVTDDVATALAEDISRIVFEPIREQLERELEHPEAKAETVSGVEQAREQALGEESAVSFQLSGNTNPVPSTMAPPQNPQSGTASPPDSRQLKAESSPIIPATPPAAPPVAKAVRAPTSNAYKAGEVSAARKNVHDDPYREAP